METTCENMKVEYKNVGHIWAEPPYVELTLYSRGKRILRYKLVFSKPWVSENAVEHVIVSSEDEYNYASWGFTMKVKDLIEHVLEDIKGYTYKLRSPKLVIRFNNETGHIIDYIKKKL